MELGYNFKAVEMQAAFALVQLGRLNEFNKIRAQNFNARASVTANAYPREFLQILLDRWLSCCM